MLIEIIAGDFYQQSHPIEARTAAKILRQALTRAGFTSSKITGHPESIYPYTIEVLDFQILISPRGRYILIWEPNGVPKFSHAYMEQNSVVMALQYLTKDIDPTKVENKGPPSYKKGDRVVVHLGNHHYALATVTIVRGNKWFLLFDDGDKGHTDDIEDIIGLAKNRIRKSEFRKKDIKKYLLK